METVNKLTKEAAIQIINSRTGVLQGEGYYKLKVTNVVPYDGKFIIGLAGMTKHHINECKRLMKEGKIDEAVNQSLSASVRSIDYLPAKGEFVRAYIKEVTTKNGVTGEFVTALTVLKDNVGHKLDLSFEEESQELPEEVKKAVVEGAKQLA